MKQIINVKGHGNKFEWTDSLTRFYNEIRSYEPLSKEDERNLFRIMKNGTTKEKETARETIIKHNLKLAVSGARAYATNKNIEELIGEACKGLIEAIEKYDLDTAIKSDNRFSTYAIEYIRRNINRFRVEYGTMVRQTNRVKTIHYMSKAKNSFMQEFEREPSSDELLVWLNENYLDEKNKIDDPNDVADMQISSIDEPLEMGDDDETGNSGFMMSYNMATKQDNGSEHTEDSEYKTQLIDKMLQGFSDRDVKILKMCFGIGYDYPMSADYIAEKMGLTPERVRQIKGDIVKKLRKDYGSLAMNLI